MDQKYDMNEMILKEIENNNAMIACIYFKKLKY